MSASSDLCVSIVRFLLLLVFFSVAVSAMSNIRPHNNVYLCATQLQPVRPKDRDIEKRIGFHEAKPRWKLSNHCEGRFDIFC